MKRAQLMSAGVVIAVWVGTFASGCDSKDQTKKAAEPTHDAPNAAPGSNATPVTPQKMSDTAMQDLGDKMKKGDTKGVEKSASNLFNAEKKMAQDKMSGATTQPAMNQP